MSRQCKLKVVRPCILDGVGVGGRNVCADGQNREKESCTGRICAEEELKGERFLHCLL